MRGSIYELAFFTNQRRPGNLGNSDDTQRIFATGCVQLNRNDGVQIPERQHRILPAETSSIDGVRFGNDVHLPPDPLQILFAHCAGSVVDHTAIIIRDLFYRFKRKQCNPLDSTTNRKPYISAIRLSQACADYVHRANAFQKTGCN